MQTRVTTPHDAATLATAAALPPWAADLVTLYEGDAVNQFILHGNVADRMVLPVGADKPRSATSSSSSSTC